MKKGLQTKVLFLVMMLTGFVSTSQSSESSNLLFIFDVSERMSGKFPEHTKLKDLNKIDVATEAFESMLEDLPENLNVGLEVYGHHGDKDCSAIEMLAPLRSLDADLIIEKLQQLEPDQGSIPLADALHEAGEALSSEQGKKTIILFSDGSDTCGGEIDEVLNDLKKQRIIVHVLGIDVKDDEVEELSKIAEANGGTYYSVNNTEEMEKSLQSINENIDTKTYQPFFRDDFAEESLSKQWQVLNPDPELMKIEKGSLVLTPSVNQAKKVKNTLRLNTPDTESDWVITANITVQPQAKQEVFELGTSNEAGTQVILAQLNINPEGNILLKAIKGTKKTTSSFKENLISYRSKNPKEHAEFFKQNIESLTVKLEKIGLEYEVSAKIEPSLNSDNALSENWVTLKKITSSPLPDDKFFIKTYSKNVGNHQTKDPIGKIGLKWVEAETITH